MQGKGQEEPILATRVLVHQVPTDPPPSGRCGEGYHPGIHERRGTQYRTPPQVTYPERKDYEDD